MNVLSWLRALPQNPIYIREKGGWGTPNAFFETVRRFSPFVVMGALVLGMCAGSGNTSLFAGNDGMIAVWCLLLIPNILLSVMTLFGVFMAPALTAPSISAEIRKGSWEILRTTPQSTRAIIFAKLFGALARLRWLWPVMFMLSILQGGVLAISLLFMGDELLFLAAPVGMATAVRPLLEIIFAALVGMYASTQMKSATMALITAYTAVVVLKIFNSSLIWLAVPSLLGLDQWLTFAISVMGPTAVYTIAVIGFGAGLLWQANKLNYS